MERRSFLGRLVAGIATVIFGRRVWRPVPMPPLGELRIHNAWALSEEEWRKLVTIRVGAVLQPGDRSRNEIGGDPTNVVPLSVMNPNL